MILKLIVFGFCGYVKSGWNIFDGFVVVISLIDVVLMLFIEIDNIGISVLRFFRLVSLKIIFNWLYFLFNDSFVSRFFLWEK